MLQYQEVEQIAHDYRKARLENADQHRLLQSIRQAQPHHSAHLQRLTYAIGQRLVQWGRQLQGQPTVQSAVRSVSTTSAVMVGK